MIIKHRQKVEKRCRQKVDKKVDSIIGYKNSKNYKNGQPLDKNWTTDRLK